MSESSAREASTPRRQPEQRRSRQRVESILDAAAELIAQGGVDATSMSDVADRAGIRLPSVYRYFPNKQAILQTLLERYSGIVREEVVAVLGPVSTQEQARAAVSTSMRAYWDLFRSDATFAAVWTAASGDPDMVAADVTDSRAAGEQLADVFRGVVPGPVAVDLELLCFVAAHLAATVVRLAVHLSDAEAEVVLDAMSDRVLPALLGLPTTLPTTTPDRQPAQLHA
jgi:AcrR family transcriptional regulator